MHICYSVNKYFINNFICCFVLAAKQIDVDSVDPETKSSNRRNNTPANSFVDPEQVLSDSDPIAQSDCSDHDPCYIPESET